MTRRYTQVTANNCHHIDCWGSVKLGTNTFICIRWYWRSTAGVSLQSFLSQVRNDKIDGTNFDLRAGLPRLAVITTNKRHSIGHCHQDNNSDQLSQTSLGIKGLDLILIWINLKPQQRYKTTLVFIRTIQTQLFRPKFRMQILLSFSCSFSKYPHIWNQLLDFAILGNFLHGGWHPFLFRGEWSFGFSKHHGQVIF